MTETPTELTSVACQTNSSTAGVICIQTIAENGNNSAILHNFEGYFCWFDQICEHIFVCQFSPPFDIGIRQSVIIGNKETLSLKKSNSRKVQGIAEDPLGSLLREKLFCNENINPVTKSCRKHTGGTWQTCHKRRIFVQSPEKEVQKSLYHMVRCAICVKLTRRYPYLVLRYLGLLWYKISEHDRKSGRVLRDVFCNMQNSTYSMGIIRSSLGE